MFIKRLPIVAVVVLLAMVLAGVLLSNALGTKASSSTSIQPPVHNHPTIHYTDGAPAISLHSDGTLLTVADVRQYVNTHRFPGGAVVPGSHLQIMILQLMTSQEASIEMRGEYIGLPDNAPVYYVVVKGPFSMADLLLPPGSKGSQTYNEGEEAFDAKTGNLLVWGIRQ